MRRLAVILASISLLASAAATAAPGAPGLRGAGGVPPFPRLAGQWSHAEINFRVRKAVHTLILDRGRIVQAAPTQITLLESDGSTVVVPLSDQTLVVIRGRPATTAYLQRKMLVETMRIDGGAAVRVRVVRVK